MGEQEEPPVDEFGKIHYFKVGGLDMADKKILVAEDSSIMRMFIATGLKKVPQIDVVEAVNGAEAMKILKEMKIDLVILDVHMPLLNGLEVLRTIRQDPVLKDIPVVLCTKDSDPREKWEKFGATAYLSKPIKQVNLNEIVKRFLGIDLK